MKKKSKSNLFIFAGHLFEHYAISLYGFFAILLAPVFFPPNAAHTAQIASFGAFAAGFLMRPLGGFAFGYIGDHLGRKRALLLSISIGILPTLFIGLLPSYEYIGIMAPILLTSFLLVQGISVGGEYSGALIYVFEHARRQHPGFKAGLLISCGFWGCFRNSNWNTLHVIFYASLGMAHSFYFRGRYGPSCLLVSPRHPRNARV